MKAKQLIAAGHDKGSLNAYDAATGWAQPAVSGNRLFVKDVGSLALWMLN